MTLNVTVHCQFCHNKVPRVGGPQSRGSLSLTVLEPGSLTLSAGPCCWQRSLPCLFQPPGAPLSLSLWPCPSRVHSLSSRDLLLSGSYLRTLVFGFSTPPPSLISAWSPSLSHICGELLFLIKSHSQVPEIGLRGPPFNPLWMLRLLQLEAAGEGIRKLKAAKK